MDEWGVIRDHTFSHKLLATFFSQLLPSWPTQCVLKSCDTLNVGIMKEISKNRIVGDAKLPTIISIGDEDYLDTVGQNW